MKKHIIWQNINLDPKNWIDDYKETAEINGWDEDTDNEDNLYRFMEETNEGYLDDERSNLNKNVNGRILAIADLGLWNGRRQGYKILTDNINSILSSDCDYCEWYDDGYNIRFTGHHHDGTNHVLYRIIREDRNIENLLDDIYNGKEISRKKLNYYTRSLHSAVADVYGW